MTTRQPGPEDIHSSRHGTSSGRRKIHRLATLLDSQFRIPLTGWRIGIEPLLGLVPVVGDLLGAALSLYLLLLARREGAPWPLMLRMLLNLALDLLLGAVPLLGDLFDFAFKANLMNARLLDNWAEEREARQAAALQAKADSLQEMPRVGAGTVLLGVLAALACVWLAVLLGSGGLDGVFN